MAAIDLPKLPVAHDGLVNYIANHPETPLKEIMDPYRKFEAKLREVYAQERTNPILDDPYLNVVPLFTKDTPNVKTRARNLEAESPKEKEKYIMTLPDDKRRPNGSPAVVSSLKEFRHNFGIFSESSLAEMDWSNVVAAGSSVVNCLLPVPDRYNRSKRALREYYHQKFCPASDVDLFLYGLNEQEAIDKIKDIETRVRDAILSEVTVVRTKNAITICSQYPTRHIQIVLRVYKSVSEILTGFDIDCSGAAYDGEQVYCTPRALASYITQINPIDLSRRSPSYENRLSKYSHRNFEVYWSELDRSRVDPTIFERSFQRVLGLARLLVLERLPTTNARDEYMKKRRQERGRPELPFRYRHRLRGNIKDIHEDEVADWVDEDEVANYHTFTIPYGEKFHAKKIEKLCYTKDLLLNAEWNQPKEREVYLHRHPAFFGRVQDVIGDCCGTCPKPETPEEIEVAEKEGEIYVSGKVTFRIDDPGRQQIGSFNPLTEDDWTEMAYVGNTARLCQAIIDGDVDHVEDWLSQEGADPNKRDYTGRTPLHLAVISSTPEVVKCLVDRGARLIARLADGRTALHLAAARGNVKMVRILLEKSNANEEEEENKLDRLRKARGTKKEAQSDETEKESSHESDDEGSDGELVSDEESKDGDDVQSMTTGSFVKVGKDKKANEEEPAVLEEDQSEPDFYKIDAVAWDSKCSPLHLAILGGHCEVVRILCQDFGADVLLPVKFGDGSYSNPNVAILTLTLALALPTDKALPMVETLLSLGATSSQAETNGVTAFQRFVRSGRLELIQSLMEKDKIGLQNAINHAAAHGNRYNGSTTNPLVTALDGANREIAPKLLEAGAKVDIDYETWLKSAKISYGDQLGDYERNLRTFNEHTEQPLIIAIRSRNPANAIELLERGADPNTITRLGYYITKGQGNRYNKGQTALDLARDILEEARKYREELVEISKPPESSEEEGFHNADTNSYQKRPTAPFGTEEFLEKFEKGTYQHWVVSMDIEERMQVYKRDLKYFEEQKEKNAGRQDSTDKLEILEDVISQLESLVKVLEAKGAKTFKEQYPDAPEPLKYAGYISPIQEPSAYTFNLTFYNAPDVTEARKAAYIKLFEAAWEGDLSTIKALTLASWDDEKQEPPLKIAVSDTKSNNPFSIAFLRGHYEVAKAILEITQAQWAPSAEKTTRFTMNKDENEDLAESDDDDEPQIYEKIIDDKFTIENVGQVSMQVKSQTFATALLNWATPTRMLRDGKLTGSTSLQTPLYAAITQNDGRAFNYLIDLNIHFTSKEPTEDESSRFYKFPQDLFDHALSLGRTEMLAIAIKRTGAGIPIEDLVKKTGSELKVKPRYYQGLSVYGKKRADWATAGRNLVVKSTGSKVPPLLTAAQRSSLESTEWFVSDAPMRLYLEFGKSKIAREDPRFKHLNEAPGGFDRAIAKWLGAQNDLVIHCAVMGKYTEETNNLIKYLIKVCPASFEAKSEEGWTPLYIACLFGKVDFAKTLIEAGADQSVKDKELNNIIHASLTNIPMSGGKSLLDRLRALLNLFDPDLRAHMFLRRNNLARGADTPLHFWLKTANRLTYYRTNRGWPNHQLLNDEDPQNVNVLRLLLEFSKGAELDILNGAGDTILHTAVLRHLAKQSQVLLEQNPNLVYRENAVGRTPSEIAYDIFINSKVESQESVEVERDSANIVTKLKRNKNMANYAISRRHRNQGSSIGRSRKETTWRVLEAYLATVPGKRRLVSLNEANDVAKRIGESYSWQRYYQKTTSTDADAEEDDEEKKKYQEQQEPKEQKVVGFIASWYDARQKAWCEKGSDEPVATQAPFVLGRRIA